EWPVVNERARHFEESPAQRAVAGDGPGFQERQSLPRLAARLVVTFEAVERVGDIARLAFRAQPQIDAVDVAFAREFAQSHGDLLAKPAKIFRGRNRRGLFPDLFLIGGVEVDQINVRAEVKLAAAELAHPQNGEAAESLSRNPILVAQR